MRAILATVVVSTLAGIGIGAALGFMEVKPAIIPVTAPSQEPATPDQPISPSQELEPAPHAEVPETVFEFGKIAAGATMSHVFKIGNTGGRPLEIEVGSTTCKCTVGNLSHEEIEPGGQAEVELEWTAKTGLGPFRHGATLLTNDPEQSRIELIVEGQVVSSTVSFYPPELVFGTVLKGESKEAETFLLAFLDQKLKVLELEVVDKKLSEHMNVRIEPVAKENLPIPDATSGLKVLATYQAGKTSGPFQGYLTLNLGLESAEKFELPISGLVVGDVSIYGPGWNAQQGILKLGTVRSSEGRKVQLILSIRGDHAETIEFDVASVDPPELQVALGERRMLRDGLAHVPLFVEIPAGTRHIVRLGQPSSSDAMIVLRTNHPETSDLRLRVRFAVGP